MKPMRPRRSATADTLALQMVLHTIELFPSILEARGIEREPVLLHQGRMTGFLLLPTPQAED